MRLEALGRLRAVGNSLTRPKPLLLLTFLAVEGCTSRRRLAELFFSTSLDPSDALSTTVRRIHGTGPWLHEDEGSLAFAARSDVQAFHDLHLAGDADRALALYCGPFAATWQGSLGVELEEWLIATRERLASQARTLFLERAEGALALGDPAAAREALSRAAAISEAPPMEPTEEALALRIETALGGTFRATIASPAFVATRPEGAAKNATVDGAPTWPTRFVGRRTECALLRSMLRGSGTGLITLHGMGGAGKTRLALEAATHLLETGVFPGGAFFVSFAERAPDTQLLHVLASRFRVPLRDGEDPVDAVAAAMGQERVLLVLDNLDGFTSQAGDLVRLTRSRPDLAVLVTSRTRLNVSAETVVPLRGLSGRMRTPGTESESDGELLFLDRLRMGKPWFVPTPKQRRAIERIRGLVDGLPLALEMAAAWAQTRSLERIADDLARSPEAMTSPFADTHHGHSRLGTVVEQSYALLSPAQRAVLVGLAVFSGGFTGDMADAVADASPPTLRTLVNAAMVTFDGSDRFDLHPIVRTMMRHELSKDTGAEAAHRARHLLAFDGSLGRLPQAPTSDAAPETVSFLAIEEDNVLAMIDWAIRCRRFDVVERAVKPVFGYLAVEGRFAEATDLASSYRARLEQAGVGAADALAALAMSVAWAHELSSDPTRGERR